MKSRVLKITAAAVALAASFFVVSTQASPILCQNINVNHMYVDSSYVSACLDSGVGNINGNPTTDDYLLAGGSGTGIGSGAFAQLGNSGTFSLDANLWNTWSSIAIGFKFGTGNKPDEWFVYQLNPQVSSGTWTFVNVFQRGGGLSHIQLYGLERTITVPEPATMALFGMGLAALGLTLRRKRAVARRFNRH